jgi:hypothetical protein
VTAVEVQCEPTGTGWRCRVTVADESGTSAHAVTVALADVVRFAAGSEAAQIERLIRDTFGFLLEREPRESILRQFDLSVVERYFPEYPRIIRDRRPR